MKSKKKIIVWLVVLALIAAVVVWAQQYYTDRYVSSDYYAMIPLGYDVTPETLYSDNNEEMGLGKVYELTAYSADGEAKPIWFTVHSIGSGFAGERELPQPGEYLLVKASNQLVTGWSLTDKNQIPAKALEKLGG